MRPTYFYRVAQLVIIRVGDAIRLLPVPPSSSRAFPGRIVVVAIAAFRPMVVISDTFVFPVLLPRLCHDYQSP